MAAAGLIISGITAAASAGKQRSARKNRQEARRIQERRRRLQQQRAIKQAIRRATIQRAALMATAAASGTEQSSAVTGATGSIQSQVGGSLGFAQQTFALRQESTRRLERAEMHQANAGAALSIASAFAGGQGG